MICHPINLLMQHFKAQRLQFYNSRSLAVLTFFDQSFKTMNCGNPKRKELEIWKCWFKADCFGEILNFSTHLLALILWKNAQNHVLYLIREIGAKYWLHWKHGKLVDSQWKETLKLPDRVRSLTRSLLLSQFVNFKRTWCRRFIWRYCATFAAIQTSMFGLREGAKAK